MLINICDIGVPFSVVLVVFLVSVYGNQFFGLRILYHVPDLLPVPVSRDVHLMPFVLPIDHPKMHKPVFYLLFLDYHLVIKRLS